MEAEGHSIRGHGIVTPHLDLAAIKAWAKSAFTKERITDLFVIFSTATVLGLTLSILHRAMQNGTVTGF
jgi:hypothetical protein